MLSSCQIGYRQIRQIQPIHYERVESIMNERILFGQRAT